jgi:iron complex outermembrane receptor protein
VSGQAMPNSPKFKAILGAEQRIPLNSIPYDVLLNGSYSYQTSAQMLPDENPQAIVPAFGLLNLSSTLAGKSGAFSVTLFCNNVFDHHYPSFVSDFWNNVWAANAVVSQPARDSVRYFGLRLNANF